jgi:hypothetical protein
MLRKYLDLNGILKPAAVGMASPLIGLALIWSALRLELLGLNDPLPFPFLVLLHKLLLKNLVGVVLLTCVVALALAIAIYRKHCDALPGWATPWLPVGARWLRATLVGFVGFGSGMVIASTVFAPLLPEFPFEAFPVGLLILWSILPLSMGLVFNMFAEPVLNEKQNRPNFHWFH